LWTVILGGQFLMLIVFAPLGLIPGLLSLLSPSDRKDPSRTCPHCDEQMRDDVVRLTGNCSACGRAVLSLSDVASIMHQHRYSTEEMLALFRSHKRLLFEGFAIFFGLFVTAAVIIGIFFPPDFAREIGGVQRVVVMIFVIAIPIILAILWVGPRYRRLNPCCPSCRRVLRDIAHLEAFILATRRCAQCRRVVAD